MNLARRIRDRVDRHRIGPRARAVLDEGLTYLAPTKLRRIEAALESVQNVGGDFAEFGVALGGSAILIADRAKGRQFHGFDVFAMIPEPASDKDDQKSKARFETIRSGASRGIKGDVYYGYRSDLFSEVKDSFRRYGLPVGKNGVFLHQGLFEETVPSADIGALAFAHIDCDWYDPVTYCLRRVAEKLSPGGVVVIDDYHDYGGCRTAVDEFRADHPEFTFEDGPNPILRRAIG